MHEVFILTHIVKYDLSPRQCQQRTQIFKGFQKTAVRYISIKQIVARREIVATESEIAFNGREDVFNIHG